MPPRAKYGRSHPDVSMDGSEAQPVIELKALRRDSKAGWADPWLLWGLWGLFDVGGGSGTTPGGTVWNFERLLLFC